MSGFIISFVAIESISSPVTRPDFLLSKTMAHFKLLPNETVVHILSRSTPLCIRRCRQVSRFLWILIDSSAELQYLLELDSLGYVQPNNPRADLTFAAKLETIREHRKRWRSILKAKPERYRMQLPSSGETSTYDFYGGVYARGWSWSSANRATRRLDLYQLPSVNKGIEYKQWTHEDVGVDTRDFAMEPDYDLLVLLEQGTLAPIADAAPGSPNVTQHFGIHLRSLASCAAHPDAAQPILSHSLSAFRGAAWSYYFQIVGRYLAVLFLLRTDPNAQDRTCEVRVWDWTTGRQVTYIPVINSQSGSFSFLSDRVIAVPRHCGELEHSGRLGTLELYAFEEPPKDSPAAEARHIASLQFPPLPTNVMTMTTFACRSDPAPSPSSQSMVQGRGRPRLFQLAPTNRVLCLHTSLAVVETVQRQFVQSEGMLYIPFEVMLGVVSDVHGRTEPAEIPWEDWGARTSWVDTSGISMGNECYVFGQRVVGLGIETDEDQTNKLVVVLMDFEPKRVKYDSVSHDGELELKLFDPEREMILADPVENDVLVNAFFEGTCKANRRFIVQQVPLGSRLSPRCPVMVDDEHVIIVVQRRLGQEHALLVY